MSQLPQWQCHKRVVAFKIIEISHRPNGDGADLSGASNDDDGRRFWSVLVDSAWIEMHAPQVGGYFVRDDGHDGYCPEHGFEKFYTRIDASGAETDESWRPKDEPAPKSIHPYPRFGRHAGADDAITESTDTPKGE